MSATRVSKGALIRDGTDTSPWHTWVVLDVGPQEVRIKRPYTHEGKSFIVFEERQVTLDQISQNHNAVKQYSIIRN